MQYLTTFRRYNFMFSLLLLALCTGLTVPAAQGDSLSRETHLKLQEASELTKAGKARQAIRTLQLLEGELQGKDYELAMVRQHLVYAYMAAEEPAIARDIAIKLLKGRQLPTEAAHGLTWLTAQIAYQLEDYSACIHYAEQWIAAESSLCAKAHFLAGYSYYRLKQPGAAERHLEHAIAIVKKIPDDWRRVLLAVYLDGKQYRKAETVLHSLIEREPHNRSWWNYLVAAYLEQNKEDKALAALVLAHHRSQLDTDDLMQIVQLYSSNGIPEKAARLLQDWLKAGRLEATHKTFRLQFELWQLACEHGPALQALEKAAALTNNGEDYFLLGRLYFERNEWQKARHALQRSLRHGVKEKTGVQYLLGVAAFNCGDPRTARRAFEKARKNPQLGKVVAYWSDRLQDRSITRSQ
jgi:tetratricopeptide (TPR) repeat protein